MRIIEKHSHLNGLEWLLVHEEKVWKDTLAIIESIDVNRCKTKNIEREKTTPEIKYIAHHEVTDNFVKKFLRDGWENIRLRDSNTNAQKSAIEDAGKQPIYSYNQTDFVKKRVAVEVQFGKYSFIAYDLFVKHLAFYVGDEIDVGIEILPMKEMQEQMSSGPGYYEGALYDLARQGCGVPGVPLVLIGVAP